MSKESMERAEADFLKRHGTLADHTDWLRAKELATFACPICGKDEPHTHSSEEVVKYRYPDYREMNEICENCGLIEARHKSGMNWCPNTNCTKFRGTGRFADSGGIYL